MSKRKTILSLFAGLAWLCLAMSARADETAPMVRGLLKPIHEATLSAEILAKIAEMPIKVGKRFKKGAVLVRFECARYKAEFDVAQAEYQARKKTSDNNTELATYNAVANLQVEVSNLETIKANAQMAANIAVLGTCTIVAPWDGRVVESLANPYETSSPGKELLRILNDSVLEIEVLAPSKWLSKVKVGTPFTFSIDETGKEYSAKISAIGAKVDPVSQTVRLTGTLDNQQGELLAGMSGGATFKISE
jgi:RND family efflux transporter MFP subunit